MLDNFGSRLSSYRESLGISLKDLSNITGIREGRLEDIESEDGTCATIYEVMNVADSLGTLVSDIVGEIQFRASGYDEGGMPQLCVISKKQITTFGLSDDSEIEGEFFISGLDEGVEFLGAQPIFSCIGWLHVNDLITGLKDIKKLKSSIPIFGKVSDYRKVVIFIQEDSLDDQNNSEVNDN